MTNEFILPDLGEGLVEATIVEWKVAVGDIVTVDQLVVEVESAKSTVELPTPFAGRVAELGGGEGETLQAGQVLLRVEDAAGAGSGAQSGRGAGPASGAGNGWDAEPDSAAGGDSDAEPDSGARPDSAAVADLGTVGELDSVGDWAEDVTPPNSGPGSAQDAGRGWSGDAGGPPTDESEVSGSGAVLVGYGTKEPTAKLRRPAGGRFGKKSQLPVAALRQAQDPPVDNAVVAPQPALAEPVEATPNEAPLRQAQGPSAENPVAASHHPVAEPVEATTNAVPVRQAQGAELAADLLDETRNSPVMSPLVRREAQAAGFDARHLHGSGPNGLVLRGDVQAAAQQLAASAPAPVPASAPGDAADVKSAAGGDHRIPLTGMRGAIADHLTASHQSVPKATIWLDVDVTPLLELKQQLKDAGEKFSLTMLIARIVVAGLRQHPRLNASFDAETREIVEHDTIHLGVAAQTPRGLAVPVVHSAERKTLRELRESMLALVEATHDGKFQPSDVAGSTFTLNNYGAFGVDGSSPIINAPESAMLGVGRLKERPWVVGGELTVRTVVTVSFVFDHRVCDGSDASAFLTYVTDRMENPSLLFADV